VSINVASVEPNFVRIYVFYGYPADDSCDVYGIVLGNKR
jgi:hypothetical protein